MKAVSFFYSLCICDYKRPVLGLFYTSHFSRVECNSNNSNEMIHNMTHILYYSATHNISFMSDSCVTRSELAVVFLNTG